MKQFARTVCVLVFASATLLTYPSIYPTGTTIFDPDRTWSGYTIYGTPESKGAVLIDMNGNLLRRWPEIAAVPGPFRILPGGYLIGGTTQRKNHQEAVALVQMAWDGSIAWRFDRTELVEDEGQPPTWMARQHHDWHREGYPAGYYSPDANPLVDSGRTLVLVHRRISNPDVSDKLLEDDGLVEADWDGQLTWEWTASEHLEEFGFSEAALISIYRRPGWSESRQAGDWLHINSATYVGPNKWYDAGDERFHPDNVIMSSRNTNIIFIAERASGAIVWKMSPDYRDVPALRELGQIIGQHHPHIIPKGLPGAGNLLIFDNGGAGGYGAPNPNAHDGVNVAVRIHSRVLEIDPVTS